MQIFSKTDVGLVRESNQDACRYGHFEDNCAWSVICDGMGGQNGGNVASKIAVETVSDILQRLYNEDLDDKMLSQLLIDSVQSANAMIFEKACKDIRLSGMGTTIDLALVRSNSLFIVHVGDSRAYLLRDGAIKQITTDHSFVQEMVANGELTSEQAMVHPNKNLITRALGVDKDIKLDFIEATFEQDDILFLATDGLTNYVSEQEIAQILTDEADKGVACDELISKAKNAGGADNITVAIMLF